VAASIDRSRFAPGVGRVASCFPTASFGPGKFELTPPSSSSYRPDFDGQYYKGAPEHGTRFVCGQDGGDTGRHNHNRLNQTRADSGMARREAAVPDDARHHIDMDWLRVRY